MTGNINDENNKADTDPTRSGPEETHQSYAVEYDPFIDPYIFTDREGFSANLNNGNNMEIDTPMTGSNGNDSPDFAALFDNFETGNTSGYATGTPNTLTTHNLQSSNAIFTPQQNAQATNTNPPGPIHPSTTNTTTATAPSTTAVPPTQPPSLTYNPATDYPPTNFNYTEICTCQICGNVYWLPADVSATDRVARQYCRECIDRMIGAVVAGQRAKGAGGAERRDASGSGGGRR